MDPTLSNTVNKRIRLLTVVFGAEIKGYEIPAFRSAVIEKAGRENVLFHNHLKSKGFLYKYPLIQYKMIHHHPSIICIDHGVDEYQKYFEKDNWDIHISGRWLEMKIDRLHLNQFNMQVWDKMFRYSIWNWVALNQANFRKYIEMDDMTDKVRLLESILKANILSFAKGIEWTIEKPVEVKISNLNPTRRVTLKEKDVLGFNVDFSTNVFLPNFIGLGKSVSLGYGVVKSLNGKNDKRNNNE